MQKFFGILKASASGALFGGLLMTYKDNILEHRWSFLSKPDLHKDLLLPSENIFKSNESFLKENLKEFYMVSANENEAHFEYIPRPASQGHMTVCHGGFTGCMAEYAIRYYAKTQNLDTHLSHFYIRYMKPIFVNHLYHIVIKRKPETPDRFDYEIWDQKQAQKYCSGHLTSHAKTRDN
jgi:acyl-coenzyme A thioesterase PaaI-like protein